MGWWAFGAFVAIILVNQGGNTAQSPEAISKPLTQVPGLVSPDKEREITRSSPRIQPAALPRTQAPVPKTAGVPHYVTGGRVNVRRGPGTGHGVIMTLNKSQKVVVHATQNGWSLISAPTIGLKQGYMAARFLSQTKPQTPRLASPAPTPRQRSIAAPSPRDIANARKAIIRQSINSYPGSCPCPYNVDRGGRRCGKRSAWSRPGGYSPICYDSDVSDARVQTYLARVRGVTR